MRRSRSADEGPVSLFSFQDIITSITGIMILVVMMLVLEVINREPAKSPTPRAQTASVPELQEQIVALETERERLSASVEQQRAVVAKLLPGNAQQLNRDIKREEAETVVLNQMIAELTAKLAKTRQQMGNTLTDTAEDRRELEELTEKLARIQAQNRITFEFTPSRKTPILVQCSRTGIRAMVMDKKPSTHTFVSGPGSDLDDSIEKFEQWVDNLNRNTNAFVVLVKPSAATYATDVIELLRQKQFDVGYEPLEEKTTAVFADERET